MLSKGYGASAPRATVVRSRGCSGPDGGEAHASPAKAREPLELRGGTASLRSWPTRHTPVLAVTLLAVLPPCGLPTPRHPRLLPGTHNLRPQPRCRPRNIPRRIPTHSRPTPDPPPTQHSACSLPRHSVKTSRRLVGSANRAHLVLHRSFCPANTLPRSPSSFAPDPLPTQSRPTPDPLPTHVPVLAYSQPASLPRPLLCSAPDTPVANISGPSQPSADDLPTHSRPTPDPLPTH